jgi:chemotaxis protein methyltransferase CheR
MDIQLDDSLYVRFRDLLRERCGLDYPARKRADLAHGLRLVLETSRHADLAALYADAAAGGPGWEILLAQLTNGETYFFRNTPQFDALRQHILPELIQRRQAMRHLRIWSAGCATGEEPYSVAMTLVDLLPEDELWQVSILATDINPQFLARARDGLYGSWSFRETPDTMRERFFTPEQNRWRLHSRIRQMVTFTRLNLAQPCFPAILNGTYAQDLILCRNVTIYFDEATTHQLIERFHSSLLPGGWLLVGHAEPQASANQQLELHNFSHTVAYRKRLDAPVFSRMAPENQL